MNDADILIEAIAECWPAIADFHADDGEILALEGELFAVLRTLRDAETKDERSAAIDDAFRLLHARGADGIAVRNAFERLAAESPWGAEPEAPDIPGSTRHEFGLVVTVPFATDREQVVTRDGHIGYGEAAEVLSFGRATVFVPDRPTGLRAIPSRLSRLGFRKGARGRPTVLGTVAVTEDDFTRNCGPGPTVLYVHGYRTAINKAMATAAGLHYDLSFPGPVVLYSWPSRGKTLPYHHDRADAEVAVPRLTRVLELILTSCNEVHTIGYSTGGEVLARALAELSPDTRAGSDTPLANVVFAATDMDARLFAQKAAKFTDIIRRVTVYVSARDLALRVANLLNGQRRTGQSGPRQPHGIDVLDVSDVSTGVKGHDYFTHGQVRDDLHLVLRNVAVTDRPNVRLVRDDPGQCWMIVPS